MIKNKMKIIILASIVAISSMLAVGFNSKIELINGDHIDLVTSQINSNNWEDKFEFIDNKILLDIDGEKIDITKYCSSDSQDIFTYEKEVGNHIQKIAIAGEPNTKSGIALARSVGNVAISQESHSSQYSIVSYFNDERTQAEQLGYCCNDGEPKWFEDAQEFLKIDKF